jgi:hypothetical protein
MEQQAPQARPGGGTSDVTIMVVLFILITIGIIAGWYLLLYKPKLDDISSMMAQRDTKKSQLNSYIAEVKDILNYEDQKKLLERKWDDNKHFYVLGGEEGYEPKDYQFAIFDAYDSVFDLGAFAGVEILHLKVAESFKYYMHDEPWDLPWNLIQFEWEVIFQDRPVPEGAEQATTQNTTAMVTAHTFTVVMRGDYQSIRRFIEVVQNMEGEYKKIMSIHCFGVSEEPSYYVFPLSYPGQGGVLADVTVELQMLMTFYELNEFGTPGPVPDVPGSVSCSFGGGGGGGGGGSGGAGGMAGGSMSIG